MFYSLLARVKFNASSAKVKIHASYWQRDRGTSKGWMETQSWTQPGEFSTSPHQPLGLWMHLYHLTAQHQETWQIAACSIKAIASCRMVCTVAKLIGLSCSLLLCVVWCGFGLHQRLSEGGTGDSQEAGIGWWWWATARQCWCPLAVCWDDGLVPTSPPICVSTLRLIMQYTITALLIPQPGLYNRYHTANWRAGEVCHSLELEQDLSLRDIFRN